MEEEDWTHELDQHVESGYYTIFATMESFGIKLTDDQLDQLASVVVAMIKEAKAT